MQRSQPSLFARHDTFFGVCEAIGQDFGFPSNYVRVALSLGLLLSPLATVAVYVGAGLLVAISRWIYPAQVANVEAQPTVPAKAGRTDNDQGASVLAEAA
ncbi:PspC domain-containing protein [Rhizorhabdus argentea]|uniref:PspC domain-containing protein n=1 Tax=Rhizorhabdus argentea TaxID=1387174 RepID=UPI0030EB9F74